MGTYLDLGDVVHGHPKAEQELRDLHLLLDGKDAQIKRLCSALRHIQGEIQLAMACTDNQT